MKQKSYLSFPLFIVFLFLGLQSVSAQGVIHQAPPSALDCYSLFQERSTAILKKRQAFRIIGTRTESYGKNEDSLQLSYFDGQTSNKIPPIGVGGNINSYSIYSYESFDSLVSYSIKTGTSNTWEILYKQGYEWKNGFVDRYNYGVNADGGYSHYTQREYLTNSTGTWFGPAMSYWRDSTGNWFKIDSIAASLSGSTVTSFRFHRKANSIAWDTLEQVIARNTEFGSDSVLRFNHENGAFIPNWGIRAEFDINGNLLRNTRFTWDDFTQAWLPDYTELYEYDSDGRILEKVNLYGGPSGTKSLRTSYHYSGYQLDSILMWNYDGAFQEWYTIKKSEYKYGGSGQLLSKTTSKLVNGKLEFQDRLTFTLNTNNVIETARYFIWDSGYFRQKSIHYYWYESYDNTSFRTPNLDRQEVKLYPNPNSTSFSLQTNESGPGHIELYNQLGQVKQAVNLQLEDGSTNSIEHQLATGTYFYRLYLPSGQIVTGKFQVFGD